MQTHILIQYLLTNLIGLLRNNMPTLTDHQQAAF